MPACDFERLSVATRSKLEEMVRDHLQTDQLQDYIPYPGQAKFHIAGRRYTHRMLRAGNQCGKSFSASAETAMHLTGLYPSWWRGWRFTRPIVCWATGDTGESVRDNPQRLLLGQPGKLGTGLVPHRCITKSRAKSKGISDLYDFVRIEHISGGTSLLRLKYYAQDRTTWQGSSVDWLWLDEEPPEDMYNEGLARLTGASGRSIMTFTPLKGRSNVVMLYLDPDRRGPSRHNTKMTLFDAQHISDADREERIASYPEHERLARVYGEPAAGEGAVFPIADEHIVCEPFDIPKVWPRLGGIDFGYSHPTAAVMAVFDINADIVYIVNEYRNKEKTAQEHWFHTLKSWGLTLKWAWPKDGDFREKNTGEQVAELYRHEGMKLLPLHAQFLPTYHTKTLKQSIVSVERGVQEMMQRMQTGRWKVFETCKMWMEEKRNYHRKDGKIVPREDDLLDASRYCLMMKRFATTGAPRSKLPRRGPNWQAV